MTYQQRLRFACLSIAAIVALGTSGCSNSGGEKDKEISELTQKVQTLEAENTELKNKLTVALTERSEMPTTAKSGQTETQSAAQTSTAPPDASKKSEAAQKSDAAQSSNTSETVEVVHFTDLQEAPNKQLIEDLIKDGMFKGMGSQFKPYEPVTRGEYATWLVEANNALQLPAKQIHFAPQLPQQFKDLPPENPCYKYVQALANSGLAIGYEDGTFRASKPISREEMIGMKVGVDMGKASEPNKGQMGFVWKFTDAKDVDNRFSGYVHDDYYISGPNGGNIKRSFGKIGAFRPKQAVVRCEAAATLWQFGHGDWARTAAKGV